MSDDVEATETSAQESDEQQAEEKTYTQSQVEKMIKGRLPEYESLKSKASQFDALTQTTEDALAAARAQAEEALAEVAWRDVILQRQEIAATKGLDPKLWSRIQGETRAEIEADINELVSIAAGRPMAKAPAFSSGASSGKGQTDKERAAEALRGVRGI